MVIGNHRYCEHVFLYRTGKPIEEVLLMIALFFQCHELVGFADSASGSAGVSSTVIARLGGRERAVRPLVRPYPL